MQAFFGEDFLQTHPHHQPHVTQLKVTFIEQVQVRGCLTVSHRHTVWRKNGNLQPLYTYVVRVAAGSRAGAGFASTRAPYESRRPASASALRGAVRQNEERHQTNSQQQ